MEKTVFKHLVVTRFLNNSNMNLGNRVFEKSTIDRGITLMKEYVLHSLNMQSNKNFTYVILVHDDVNKEYINELYSLGTDFETVILKNSEYSKYINDVYNKHDYVITTRIDYDDMIYFGAADDIQKFLMNNLDKSICAYGYRNGATYNIDTNEYRLFNHDYKSIGSIAIFESLFVKTSNIKRNVDVYSFSHTRMAEDIKNSDILNDGKIGYTPMFINQDSGVHFVYVRHEQNDSKFGNKNGVILFDGKAFFGTKH